MIFEVGFQCLAEIFSVTRGFAGAVMAGNDQKQRPAVSGKIFFQPFAERLEQAQGPSFLRDSS